MREGRATEEARAAQQAVERLMAAAWLHRCTLAEARWVLSGPSWLDVASCYDQAVIETFVATAGPTAH